MSHKRIILLYATTGSGHKTAAFALQKSLQKKYPEAVIDVLDVLAYMPIVGWLYRKGYDIMVMRTPVLYKLLYWFTSTPHAIEQLLYHPRLWMHAQASRLLLHHLRSTNPDVVVSLHIFPAAFVGLWREQKKITARHVVVMTDFLGHRLWIHPEVDAYTVATPQARDFFVAQGVDPIKITVTGIPITTTHHHTDTEQAWRGEQGIAAEVPVVGVHLYGQRPKNRLALAELLLATPQDRQYIFFTGRDEVLAEQVREMVEKKTDQHHLVVGFTKDMPRWLAASAITIAKAGGLISAESLAAHTAMILVDPIPGQEEENAEYLTAIGVAVRATHIEEVPARIAQLLAAPLELDAMRRAGHDHAPHQPAEQAADVVMGK